MSEPIIKPIDIAIITSLTVLAIVTAHVSSAFGAGCYLFIPTRAAGFGEPPSSPWTITFITAIAVGVLFASRKYSAFLFAGLPFLTLLGLPIGKLLFQWTPGVGQFILLFLYAGLATYVWSQERLHTD